MSSPDPRQFVNLSKPGGWFSEEDFLNELTVFILATNTIKALAMGMVDSNGNQVDPVSVAASIGDGRKTVPNAAMAVQLSATSVPCKSVTIIALAANTGVICVGGSTVVAAASTRRGAPLNALDSIKLFVSNLNAVWIDSTVNLEGVSYVYEA